jgi:hypothetical protein
VVTNSYKSINKIKGFFMFLDNKYNKIYFLIINKAKNEVRNKKNNYYENHHIIPKSLGGDNSKDNLVLLTAKEHYICHKLLTKFTIGESKKKMYCAMWMFNRKSNNQQRQVLTSRDYEYVRSYISKTFSEDRKGKLLVGTTLSAEHKLKLSKALKGKPKSEETKQKMKENWHSRGPRSKEHCEALSKANKGKIASVEARTKMSKARKGINPVHTQIKWQCEYCNKEGIGISNYNRWHGKNCKHYG